MYPKFLVFKLPNVSNKEALSICKRLLRSTINKHNKELQHLSKEVSLSENILSTQLFTIDVYILLKFITLHNKMLLQKVIFTEEELYFVYITANETITNLLQSEISQEESDLLKAALYNPTR